MNIVLIGSFSSTNKGDMAMHIVLMRALQEAVPDSTIWLLTPFASVDQSRYDESGLDVHCVQSPFLHPVLGSSTLITAYLLRLVPRLQQCLPSPVQNMSIFKALSVLANADYVIDVSGDATGESYGFLNFAYRWVYTNTVLAFNKPLIFASQMVGPFTYSRRFYRNVFRRSLLVVVRDPLSYQRVVALDNQIRVVLRHDLAFLLQPETTSRVKPVLAELRGARQAGPIVGLNVSLLLLRFLPKITRKEFIESVAGWVHDFLRNHPSGLVVFVPHVVGVGSKKDDRLDDQLVGRSVYESLAKEDRQRYLMLDELSPGELKAVIGNLDLLVSARMHACIAALSMEVPVVNLAYSDKSVGLLVGSFGMRDSVVDIRRECSIQGIWAQVNQRVEQILTGDGQAQYKASREKLVEVKQEAQRGLDEVVAIVSRYK